MGRMMEAAGGCAFVDETVRDGKPSHGPAKPDRADGCTRDANSLSWPPRDGCRVPPPGQGSSCRGDRGRNPLSRRDSHAEGAAAVRHWGRNRAEERTKQSRGVDDMVTEGGPSSIWDEHVAAEFSAKSADRAVATMTARSYVNLIPLMVGARGRDEVRRFYANHFV